MLRLLLAALLLVISCKDVDSSPLPQVKGGSQEGWFNRTLSYMESNPETLEELMTHSSAVVEGDLVLSDDRNAVESMWPTPEIPYVISPELESRTDAILSAMAMLSEHTCVTFHKRTSETNYLLFVTSKGCASYVGFIGGEQPMFIGPRCKVGNIVHEILHALGFHHEHTREDREQHITILSSNIMDGMERNFKKQQGKTFDLRYDITSIMHYGSGFFSANGLPTIISNTDVKGMGQRDKMTKTDIERVRLLYSCDAPEQETDEKESSDVKKEIANAYVPMGDMASAIKTTNPDHVSANRPEEAHTSAPLPPSASLQLNAATRGHNHTST